MPKLLKSKNNLKTLFNKNLFYYSLVFYEQFDGSFIKRWPLKVILFYIKKLFLKL